jgi:hypothetical protein
MNHRWKLLACFAALLCAMVSISAEQSKPAPPPSAQESPAAREETPKRHQATGIVIRLTDTTIVVTRGRGKQKTNWSFVRNEKTKTIGLLTRAAKVTVYYHEENGKRIAERIKVLEAATPPAANLKPPASKPKS